MAKVNALSALHPPHRPTGAVYLDALGRGDFQVGNSPLRFATGKDV
jgi:hypothetical protein